MGLAPNRGMARKEKAEDRKKKGGPQKKVTIV